MSDGTSSAVQRTPQEIWWMILDEVINVPLFFATTYKGNHWAKDARKPEETHDRTYQRSEEQRKVIGSVCRSWQDFARSRRGRSIILYKDQDWETETVLKAHHAVLRTIPAHYILARGTIVEWEVLNFLAPVWAADFASKFAYPRLRRLTLSLRDHQPLLHEIVRLFPNITWLDCDVYYNGSSASMPITLPWLQVFRGECGENYFFPLSNFILPSLRQLYMFFDVPIQQVLLLDMLLPFRQSLQSVVIRIRKDRGDSPTIMFPPWSDFPNLRELQLNPQWSVHFEPLPRHHPLQRLNVQVGSFDVLQSLLDGIDMRQLTLQRARWIATGELIGRIKTMKIETEQAAQLWERAKARGIRFEVTRRGKRILNRDEMFGTATSRVTLTSLFDQL